MVLALAVHTIQDRPTAKVPLSMIALLDLVKTKGTSSELKCRQVSCDPSQTYISSSTSELSALRI